MEDAPNMAHLDILHDYAAPHPIDVVEQVMEERDWPFTRAHDDELATEYRGKWSDLQIHFAWSEEIAAIHTACTFDFRIPDPKRRSIHDLLALINDKLWLGHFCLWQNEGLPCFATRYFCGRRKPPHPSKSKTCWMSPWSNAIGSTRRFNMLCGAGKEPQEALDASIIEPAGKLKQPCPAIYFSSAAARWAGITRWLARSGDRRIRHPCGRAGIRSRTGGSSHRRCNRGKRRCPAAFASAGDCGVRRQTASDGRCGAGLCAVRRDRRDDTLDRGRPSDFIF